MSQNFTYYKDQKPNQTGNKYTDDLFPPNEKSLLGLDSNGTPIDQEAYNKAIGGLINKDNIEFKRASEIYTERYVLIADNMQMDDIVPGEIDDIYFLFSVQNLCKNPGNINKLFVKGGQFFNPDGYYELLLFINGQPQIVIVDDYLPVKKGTNELIFAHSKPEKNEIWISLLEKAWAKVNGGYANIIGGTPMEALDFLTGFSSLSYDTENKDNDDLNEYKIEIVKQLQDCDIENSIISCTTSTNVDVSGVGLNSGYTYNLLAIYQVQDKEGKNVYLFKLRNPWSKGEWNGDWSDKSSSWDDKLKTQVGFINKEDGIFFMSDNDFFKFFKHVEICYLLYDAKMNKLTITGEEKNKNGIVHNIVIKGDGFLSVAVLRKSWRLNRELKDKMMPTHISVVRYDPDFTDRYKCFSDYTGNFESYTSCALNTPVKKGNYLIYIYRDLDHSEFTPDDALDIKLICTQEYECQQMSYDERDKGFPLLQNIILQAEFRENNYDPEKAEDFDLNSNQIRGNGIGHVIYYISTPGNFLSYTGSTKKVANYIMLNPYLNAKTTKFNHVIAAGKYLVLLGLLTSTRTNYSFACFSKAYTTSKTMKEVHNSNDIDLKLYTDINNNIKNENKIIEIKTQSLEKAKNEKYYDVGNEPQQTKTLEELKNEYKQYMPMLDDVPGNENDSSLKWVVIKGEYVIYIGQVNNQGKRTGKGILINPNNVFAGEFKQDLPNGKGYIYNGKNERQYYDTYVNGLPQGDRVTAEEEAEIKKAEEEERKRIEEEERKRREEEERKRREEEEAARQAELKRLEEERKKKEEEEAARQAELKRLEEERKKKEEEEAARQAELKRLEEERKKEEERIKEELRLAEEKKKQEEERLKELERLAAEEAKKKEEELKRQEEERKKELERIALQKAKEAEEAKKKAEEELKKQQKKLEEERKALEAQAEEEARKKAEELKKQQEELQKKLEEEAKKAEEAKKKAEEEAEKKKKELEEEMKKKAEEEAKKAEEAAKKAKEAAELAAQKAKEEAKKKAEELKKQQEEAKKKAEELKRQQEEAKKKAEEEAKKALQKAKEDAEKKAAELKKKAEEDKKKAEKKIQGQIEQAKDKIKAAAEERKKQLQKQREEQQKLQQTRQTRDSTGNRVNYRPDGYDINNSKRRNNTVILFDKEAIDMCIQCCCNIF